MHFRIFSYSPLVFVFAADMLIHVIKSLLMYLEFVGPYVSHRLSHMRFAKLVSTLWNCRLSSSCSLIDKMFRDSLGKLFESKRAQIWEIPRSAYFFRKGFLAEISP